MPLPYAQTKITHTSTSLTLYALRLLSWRGHNRQWKKQSEVQNAQHPNQVSHDYIGKCKQH